MIITKIKLFLITIILLSTQKIYCQNTALDSLFTHTGVRLVHVKDVSTDFVKYSYPKETAINTLSVNSIFKIRFASGRLQTFYRPPVENPQTQPVVSQKQQTKISSELLRKIITQDCDAIQEAASCTVSSNCNFKILEYTHKGGGIYSIEVKSIGTFYDILLSLEYEIISKNDGKISYALQDVYCYK